MSAQIVLLDDDQAALERTQYLLKQDDAHLILAIQAGSCAIRGATIT